jgi:hypothetical protein
VAGSAPVDTERERTYMVRIRIVFSIAYFISVLRIREPVPF